MTSPEWPPNWAAISGREPAGPVAIFDLDGVLSDASHRQHFLRADPADWDGFGALAPLDPPIPAGREQCERWRADHVVVIVTARPLGMREVTLAWLDEHGIEPDLVAFRASGDFRPSPDMKRDELERIRSFGGDVRIVFDDEMGNVEMYRRAGVEVVYVHSGYYDDETSA